MPKKHIYEGRNGAITYELKRCIHAAECVRGLPEVFNPDAKPWVDADGAAADEVATVIARCPTGALQYERTDDGPAEQAPAINTITVIADGPLHVHGDLALAETAAATPVPELRVALCRCGASKNKPYCDNSHRGIDFEDPGALGTSRLLPEAAAQGGVLGITPAANGPLLLQGPFELSSTGAKTVCSGEKAALCRCGASENKPYCDGSHRKIGFEAS